MTERMKPGFSLAHIYATFDDSEHALKVLNERDKAIEILRRISNIKNPFHLSITTSTLSCCVCFNDYPNHEPDCSYIQAKQLLQEIDNG